MRLFGYGIFLSLIASVAIAATPTSTRPRATPREAGDIHKPTPAMISACFIPAQKCIDTIVAKILDPSTTDLKIQGYGFTSKPIIDAINAIHNRKKGNVEVILDKSNDIEQKDEDNDGIPDAPKFSGAETLSKNGVPVWIDYLPAIAHNKVIIIGSRDETGKVIWKTVIGGSYNYTMSAENRNAENVTITESDIFAGWYVVNFESRKTVARRYIQKTE